MWKTDWPLAKISNPSFFIFLIVITVFFHHQWCNKTKIKLSFHIKIKNEFFKLLSSPRIVILKCNVQLTIWHLSPQQSACEEMIVYTRRLAKTNQVEFALQKLSILCIFRTWFVVHRADVCVVLTRIEAINKYSSLNSTGSSRYCSWIRNVQNITMLVNKKSKYVIPKSGTLINKLLNTW